MRRQRAEPWCAPLRRISAPTPKQVSTITGPSSLLLATAEPPGRLPAAALIEADVLDAAFSRYVVGSCEMAAAGTNQEWANAPDRAILSWRRPCASMGGS
jgi:hypothetical protein